MDKRQNKGYKKSLRRTPGPLSQEDIPNAFKHREAIEYARQKGNKISDLSKEELNSFVLKNKKFSHAPKAVIRRMLFRIKYIRATILNCVDVVKARKMDSGGRKNE